MASSPAETASPKAFALQELVACWNQAYEALVRGDLERVAALMDVADERIAAAPATPDGPVEARLRADALSARGRLEHAMRAGLQGLRDEMARARVGGRALRGYAQVAPRAGDNLQRQV